MKRLHLPSSDRDVWYHILFVTLLLSMLVRPLVEVMRWGATVGSIMNMVMLLSCVMAMGRGRASRIVAWTFLIGAAALRLSFHDPDTEPHMIGQGLGALIMVMVCSRILKRIFTTRNVTWGTISGAVAVFLLLSVVWTMFYSMAAWSLPLEPAFNGVPPASELLAAANLGQAQADVESLLSYFSLVTLTTLGYGDISPAHAITRGLATTQAVVGQLYLVVLVARLVSMQTRSSMNDAA